MMYFCGSFLVLLATCLLNVISSEEVSKLECIQGKGCLLIVKQSDGFNDEVKVAKIACLANEKWCKESLIMTEKFQVFKCVHEVEGQEGGNCVRIGNLVELKMAFADLVSSVDNEEESNELDDELTAAIKRQLPFETMNYGRKKRQLPFETLNYGKRSESSDRCDCSHLGFKRAAGKLPFDTILLGKRGLPFETLNYGKRAKIDGYIMGKRAKNMAIDGYIMGKRRLIGGYHIGKQEE